MSAADLPPISHVLETILYTKPTEKSTEFYTSILGLKPLLSSPRGTGYMLGNTMLLVFQLGKTTEDIVEDGGRIAKHGPPERIVKLLMDDANTSPTASLRQHFCLAVENRADVERWEEHFVKNGVLIIGKMDWERGGCSVYFEDPDGHCGEIGSRGIWPNY